VHLFTRFRPGSVEFDLLNALVGLDFEWGSRPGLGRAAASGEQVEMIITFRQDGQG